MMNNEIRVWDPLIRIFHWSLVLAFTIGFLTSEAERRLHIYAGYTVLGLIIFRVIWGLIGTRYARFSNFVNSPGSVVQYLKGLVARKPQHYIGHNPAGGWMVIAMLLCLFVISVSGLKLYAIEEGLGPLADNPPALVIINSVYAESDNDGGSEYRQNKDSYAENEEAEEFWEAIHEVSSNFMLLLVFLHITGVLVSGRLENEHLVKAMITGKKISKTGAGFQERQ